MNTLARAAVTAAPRPRALPSLVVAILLCPAPAHAMSYTLMDDASLFDQSDAVVLAQVIAAGPVPGRELDATRYQLAVEEAIKGATLPGPLTIDVPGAFDRTRAGALEVPGAPAFDVAERVLLFAHRRAGGGYGVAQLPLGAFHVRAAADGSDVLVRDLAVDDASGSGSGADAPGQLRDLHRFASWLRERAGGLAALVDYWHAGPLAPRPKFATQGSPAARWFEFDGGGNVTFYAGSAGQVNLSGGGYAQFQQALAAWNGDIASIVRYAYGGISGAAGGLAHSDGVNQIVFNDPFGDIGGSYDCVHGGVIGYTGFRTGALRQLGGTSFRAITEADVVIQNGAACILEARGGSSGAELMAHELGHALGLAHSCGDAGSSSCTPGSPSDNALMRPVIHNDGRGAALQGDDRLGLLYLYPLTAVVGLPLPSVGGDGGGSSPDQQVNAPSNKDGGGGGGGGALDARVLGVLLLGLLRRVGRRATLSQTPPCIAATTLPVTRPAPTPSRPGWCNHRARRSVPRQASSL